MGRRGGNLYAMTVNRKRTVEEECSECHSIFRRPSGRRLGRCPECRLEALRQNMINQHNRSGEHYEKTVKTQAKFWREEAKRLGVRA